MTSYRFSIDPKERKVGRFLGRVRRELQKAFEEEKAGRRLTQAAIARVLNVDRSVINRQLVGTENMTLRRVGELAWALGRDLNFSLTKPLVPTGANYAPAKPSNEPHQAIVAPKRHSINAASLLPQGVSQRPLEQRNNVLIDA